MEFVATCATGMEPWLADELREIAGVRPRPLTGQVSWAGPLRTALSACLWSRLSSRIVTIIARDKAYDADGLYQLVHDIPWQDHLFPGTSIAIDAQGTNASLRSTRYVAQRTKDAIMDALMAKAGFRPTIDLAHPDLRIVVRISRGTISVGINLVGAPLFLREASSYPAVTTGLPSLRSDHGAWMLRALCWHERGSRGDIALLSLFNGAGTLLVEAAGMALDRAPALLRQRWGHTRWLGGDARLWDLLLEEARGRAESKAHDSVALFDCDTRHAAHAQTARMLRAAGMSCSVRALSAQDLSSFHPDMPFVTTCDLSWLRPDRPADEASALTLLATLSATLAQDAPANTPPNAAKHEETPARNTDGDSAKARLAVLSRTEVTRFAVREPAVSSVATMLGKKPAMLSTYACTSPKSARVIDVSGMPVTTLVAASDQFAARLAKVARTRSKWARHEDVSCYRVYDADLPDYNLSIDLFEGSLTPGRWLQVSEYAPPKGIDPIKAHARLLDALAIASTALDVDVADMHVRVRTRSSGGSQYASEAKTDALQTQANEEGRTRRRGPAMGPTMPSLPSGAHLVDEGGLTFEINFDARHDCGLFLDHRQTRAWLRELAKGYGTDGRFLNLFCYTGSASVYAADGGCRHTTSVDMSAPSLDWARRNMAHNGFGTGDHHFVRADVTRWVVDERHSPRRYDLVFCDVPTFSNSSRMGRRSFDVQRDHTELLIGVSRLLSPASDGREAGICVFSCNLRSFRPDVSGLAHAGVNIEDVTERTIPQDFARTPNVHHCYLVRRLH